MKTTIEDHGNKIVTKKTLCGILVGEITVPKEADARNRAWISERLGKCFGVNKMSDNCLGAV